MKKILMVVLLLTSACATAQEKKYGWDNVNKRNDAQVVMDKKSCLQGIDDEYYMACMQVRYGYKLVEVKE